MKKTIYLVLFIYVVSCILPTIPVYANEVTTKPPVYTEILRLDFDELELKDHFLADEIPNTDSFDAAYSGIAMLRSTTSTYSYAVVGRDGNGRDRCIELKQTDVVTNDGNDISEGTTTLQLAIPNGTLGLNKGVFKISYDIKLPKSSVNKPFIRVKTHHGNPAAADPWGPCLNAIGPINEDGTLDYDDKDPTVVYGTFSQREYTASNSAESHSHFTTDFNEKIQLELDKWINVEISIDTDNKKIDYYYDGVYVGSQTGSTFAERYLINPNIAKYIQIQVYQGWRAYSGCQLDNITFSKLSQTAIASELSTNISAVDMSEDSSTLTLYGTVGKINNVDVVDGTTGKIIPCIFAVAGNKVTVTLEKTLDKNGIYNVYIHSGAGVGAAKILLGTGGIELLDSDVIPLSLDIVDENGGNIKAGDMITASAVLQNGTGKKQTANLIVAIYNNGYLTQIKSTEITTDQMIMQDALTITVDDGKFAEAKAFLWSDTVNCKPLTDTVTYDDSVELFETFIDFESDDELCGLDQLTGTVYIKSDDNNNATLFYGANSGNSTATKSFPTSVDRDVLHIGFDYKTSGYINKFIVYMSGTESSAKLFYDGGTIGYYPEVTSWNMSDERAEYTPGEWLRFDCYLDFESRMVYWYKDKVLFGSTYIPDNLKKVDKVYFLNENSNNDIYLDNIKIETLNNYDESMPNDLREYAFIDVTSDNAGHIFFEKENSKFVFTAKNKLSTPKNYILKYYVKNESGSVVYSNMLELEMDGDEVKTFEISADSGGYGYYYLTTELYDKTSQTLITKGIDYKFSVANIPENGVKDENMGIQFVTRYSLDADDRYIDLPLMQKLGFSMVRGGGLRFEYVLEDGTLPDDKWMNKWYEACRDRGMTVIGGAAFNNPKITPENPPRSEEALRYFAKYAVDHCAYHEKIYGTPPEDMEVWNEYYIEGSAFNPDKATPADYANMLVAVYNAVKAKYPTVKIWGMSGVGLNELEWTENVLKALPKDGKKYMDGVAVHPYANTSTPENANFVTVMNNYRKLFADYGYENIEFFATEWGWPSVGHSGFPDEEKQASYFVRGNVINKANNLFKKISWYAINDIGLNGNDKENRFGFVKGAYSKIGYEAKPLFLAAANYQNLMIDAEYVDYLKPGFLSGVHIYRFKLRDGRDALVLWAHKYAETIKLNIDAESLTMIDVYGNEQTVLSSDNTYTIKAGVSPCYIVGDFTQYSKK